MVKTFALVGVTFVALSTPAMAQDQADYSGFRAEALIGYDRVALDLDTSFEAEAGLDADGGHTSGVFYGVALGYDYTAAGFLFGIDAELSDSSIGETYTFDQVDVDGTLVDGTLSLDAARDLYVGGRIGAAFSSTAYYVKAGYSMARFSADARGSIDGQLGDIGANLDVEGLRLGGGVEQKLGQNTFVKLEYRYTNYGEAKVKSEGEELDADEIFDVVDLDRHQAVVGFGYRF